MRSPWFCVGYASVAVAQTLYGLAPSTPSATATGLWEIELGSTTISAAGVDADGMTTYVQEVFVSAYADSESGSIFDVTPNTHIQTATFIEDATRVFFNPTSDVIHAACTWDKNGQGVCVDFVPDITETFTETWSGSVVPWTTLNAAVAAVTTAPPSSPSSPPTGGSTSPSTGDTTPPSPSATNTGSATAAALSTHLTLLSLFPTLLFFL